MLRLAAGDAITLFNGDGHDYPSRITGFGRGTVEVAVEGRAAARPESPLAVTLVQGIARGERMDLDGAEGDRARRRRDRCRSRRHAASCGSTRETRERKLAHWRGIAVAACEQCGRARIPSIAVPVPLAERLRAPAAGARFLLAPDASVSLADAARGQASVEVLVGPEGGLEDGEREAALAAGYRACRLGPRVLRSETAAIAALAVLQAVAGDL